jgi:hypothetical protein
MKRNIYRVSLFPNSNSMCDTIALFAAGFNGGKNAYTLEDLRVTAQGYKMLYPSLSDECNVELIGENTLHIDRKVNDQYETVLSIEQVEILELELPKITNEEAKDLLEEIRDNTPTLPQNN